MSNIIKNEASKSKSESRSLIKESVAFLISFLLVFSLAPGVAIAQNAEDTNVTEESQPETNSVNSDIQPIEPAVPELTTLLDNKESDGLQPAEASQETVEALANIETLANQTVTIDLSKLSTSKTQSGTGWFTQLGPENERLIINSTKYDYFLKGQTSYTIEVEASPVTLTFNNVNLPSPFFPGLVVHGTTTLNLEGSNSINGGYGNSQYYTPAAISLNPESSLTVNSTEKSADAGKLVLTSSSNNGFGIKGDGSLTVNGGLVQSINNGFSARTITVNGGTLQSTISTNGTNSGQGGQWGGAISCKTFYSYGGTTIAKVTGIYYPVCGLAVDESININGGTVIAEGFHGIACQSSISISSNSQVTAISKRHDPSGVGSAIYTFDLKNKDASISGTARLVSGRFDSSINTKTPAVVSIHNAGTLTPVKSISIPATTTSFATTVPSGNYASYFYSDTQSGSLLKVSDNSATLSSTTSTTPVPVKLGTDSFITRHAGAGRYDTSSSIAQTLSALGGAANTKTVIIASGENYPDALAASGLSGIYGGAPVVLTNPTTLSTQAKSAISATGAENAIIVGSSKSVSNFVLSDIDALPSVKKTTRLSGTNRQGTAEAIYNSSKDWSHTAIIATDANYADALSVAPYAAASKSPIFLTLNKTSLTERTLSAIKSGDFKRIIVVGSSAAVSDAAFNSACRAAGIDPKDSAAAIRLSGTDRYKTCMAIVNWITDPARQTEDGKYSANTRLTWTYPAVTTGENYPDALAGGALQGHLRSVILLSQPNQDQGAGSLLSLHHKEVLNLRVFGSAASVSTSVVSAYATAARDNS